MAGIDNLKARLLEDDRQAAQAIEKEALKKADELIESSKCKAEEIVKLMADKAQRDGKDRKDRILARAALNARNELLAAKQEAVEKVLTSAYENVEKMDKKEYSLFLERMLLSSVETGDEEIIFDENDLSRIDTSLVKRVNKILKERGRRNDVTISSENRSIRNGFILKRGDLEINCSIDAQIRSLREELEGEIAAILFT
jgi:V/A-type H+-transporting ATPase subunit E